MKNIKNDKEEILLSLIKDDLVNSRLMNILHSAGLNPINYYLNLKETIFKIAGLVINKEDALDHYYKAIQIVNDVDIFKNPEVLDRIAVSLYKNLVISLKPLNEEYN
ncbi:MAG TPA: hypothetical protein VLB84_00335 [Bacteroidia bacterium]|nr:hypothetical protein [Bacteroidia bacterium]